MRNIFKYVGPYNDELLSDIIKTYTQTVGVEIEATLQDTKNPTLRMMTVTVQAPKSESMFDKFNEHNDVTSDRKVPRYPKPNSNLGA